MYELIGHNGMEDKVVATFDYKKDAEKYIKKSKLKRKSFVKWFRSDSLLAPYHAATVRRKPSEIILPHNPSLEKN